MSNRAETVLCCPDKFRGSISAPAAAAALAEGVAKAGLSAVAHPMADGGEGTLEAVLSAGGGRCERMHVPDALARERPAQLGVLPDGSVLVEMAQAVGLAALAPEERDVMGASTYGVGLMIRRAFELSPGRIVVTLGGSATMDGGLGALRALGARVLDGAGVELTGCGDDLLRVERIDTTGLIRPRRGAIEIAVDAWCPVHGERGSAATFGPQKGATAAQVDLLDHGFERLADLLGLEDEQRRGLGTGGAFAAPFAALLGARVRSGAGYVRQATDFERALKGARICVTGEGRIDSQSGLGKAPAGVIEAAGRQSVPTVVVGGAIDDEGVCLYDRGAVALFPIGRSPRSWHDARVNAADDLRAIGRAIGGMVAALAPAVEDTATPPGNASGLRNLSEPPRARERAALARHR